MSSNYLFQVLIFPFRTILIFNIFYKFLQITSMWTTTGSLYKIFVRKRIITVGIKSVVKIWFSENLQEHNMISSELVSINSQTCPQIPETLTSKGHFETSAPDNPKMTHDFPLSSKSDRNYIKCKCSWLLHMGWVLQASSVVGMARPTNGSSCIHQLPRQNPINLLLMVIIQYTHDRALPKCYLQMGQVFTMQLQNYYQTRSWK